MEKEKKRIRMPYAAEMVATAKNAADAVSLVVYAKGKQGKRYRLASGYYAEI